MTANGTTASTDLVVHRAGDGRAPVGYLHGLIGTSPDAPILAAASDAGLAITAPCLPGFSGSPPSTETRTIHDWVFHLSAVLDATGLVGRPMIAASVGAMIATELAAIRPEAFSHLVLVGPLGLWDDDDPVGRPVRDDPVSTAAAADRRPDRDRTVLRRPRRDGR